MNVRLVFSRLIVTVAVAMGAMASPGIASAQTELVLAFSGGGPLSPRAPLIQATDGNFYGTTTQGGFRYFGAIFKMTPAGTFTVLHTFVGGATDGASPVSALVQATDGNLYGTTQAGGTNGAGTIFRMTLAGAFTVLYSFNAATDGSSPQAALIQATDGNLYGTTNSGGVSGGGTVFKITLAGTFTVLRALNSATDGNSSSAALVQATNGNFYGTTQSGGASGGGTVFSVTSTGTFTVLHAFGVAADAGNSRAALIQATDGNLYGTTQSSGPAGNGTVFKMTLAGTFTVMYSFTGGADGGVPGAAVIQATDGNFYGTTQSGGGFGFGTAFKMTPAGTFTVLHSFNATPTDGGNPLAALIQAADGKLYGTTNFGGASSAGTVFSMTLTGTTAILYSFSGGATGVFPSGAIIQATDGNFYGTTSNGGAPGQGIVYRLAPSGTFTVLHTFAGGPTDGAFPGAALVQASDGKLYGTTQLGGAFGTGTAFSITSAGSFTLLHSFNPATEGSAPSAAIIQATDGNFYGSTQFGGASGNGTLFRMTASGTTTVLHSFAGGMDGRNAVAALLQATDGNLYGTTPNGGAFGNGTAFKMTLDGTFTILHEFAGYPVDGSNARAALIQGRDGNLYGTTASGGSFTNGMIFRMAFDGAYDHLHSFFSSTEGSSPAAALIEGADGSLYGTTQFGGATGGGTVFKQTFNGLVVVHLFVGGSMDGANSAAPLIKATDGRLYGTTINGGDFGVGVVFRLRAPNPPAGDFNGDGRADVTVYRPSTGVWWVLRSGTFFSTTASYQWGVSTDVPVPRDYDGDGKADIAVFRPATGIWYILLSTTNFTSFVSYQWGVSTDVPVPGDYDGDGKTDVAVYRPATGVWYVLLSSTQATSYNAYQWGVSTDTVVPMDYDGDGKTDIAIYRPSSGVWYILLSSTNFSSFTSYQWGAGSDLPVAADYDGDGKADIGIYRPTTAEWFLLLSTKGYTPFARFVLGVTSDVPADVPVPADYDGDGMADVAIYRPASGIWSVLLSSRNFTNAVSYQWGTGSDIPVLKRP